LLIVQEAFLFGDIVDLGCLIRGYLVIKAALPFLNFLGKLKKTNYKGWQKASHDKSVFGYNTLI